MLDKLRDGAKGPTAKILLAVLVLSFAALGIADVFRFNFVGNSVLTAGKTIVTPTEFRLAYARQLQVAQQQMGARLSAEQAKALGLDSQVTQQLIAGAVLDEQARIMDLGLSRDRLAALTGEDPAFKGNDGAFSRGQFDAVLRSVGMRPEDYFKSREKIAVRQQIVDAVTDSLPLPKTFLAAVAQHDGENRTVDFVTIPASVISAITTVDDAAKQRRCVRLRRERWICCCKRNTAWRRLYQTRCDDHPTRHSHQRSDDPQLDRNAPVERRIRETTAVRE